MVIPMRGHPYLVLVGVLLLGLLVWGFWPQPVMVEAVAVLRDALTITIEEEGRTRVINRYVIAAPVDGVACRVDLKVGDAVTKDQVLFDIAPLASQVLDPRSRAQALAQVSAAESALHAAREQARSAAASAKLASIEFERLRPLAEQGLISREAFDKAETEAQTRASAKRSASFNVDVASHELEAAESMLEYGGGTDSELPEQVAVRSPISGRILKVVRECEGPVRTGEPLLEVGDPTALEVEVDVLSADAVKIKPGMKILFGRWGGEEALEGVVRIIEPVGFTKISALGVEEQRVLIISDFTSAAERWQRLGDGYRVEASFILWREAAVLQVPASSLFRYNDGWATFVIEGSRALRRAVTVGQRNGLAAQILEGLEEGERVVNHPGDAVEDGVRIDERAGQ